MTTMSTRGAVTVRHLSIRVPWHDDGWRGTVCQRPTENASCLFLPRIREEKDDARQEAAAGSRFGDELDETDWPPCVPERLASCRRQASHATSIIRTQVPVKRPRIFVTHRFRSLP